MTLEGPPLDTLTRRLAECPAALRASPHAGASDPGVVTEAVVCDVLVDLGVPPPPWLDLTPFRVTRPEQAPRAQGLAVVCWLLHAPELRGLVQARGLGAKAAELLSKGLDPLLTRVSAELLVNDPDRREELVRAVLRGLGLRPAGEREEYAQDRLQALDSVERERVLAETRAQVERARKLREAMARKAAEEAAARYSGE